MNKSFFNNYKDNDPISTINNIRSILNKHGILPIETNWFNSIDGFYSIHLQLPRLNVFSNGKGVNSEYSLASAYGEFMERLQNQVIYRGRFDFSEKAVNYKNFIYSPDEIYLDVEDILKGEFNGYKVYIPPKEKINIDYNTISKWQYLNNFNSSSKILAIPFYSFNEDTLYYVPIPIIDLYYSTNGMCAGNTMEEAAVEGLCEIFERYVKYKILSDEIVPPTIPLEYIEKFYIPYNMIKELESTSNFKVIVKDCSLGKNLPVVAVIIIDTTSQKYFWSFGSHPVFEIALTRTLTELLQGKDINNLINLMDFRYLNKSINDSDNKLNSFIDGTGYFPVKSFSNSYSYKFNGFEDMTNKSNTELFKYSLSLLKSMNYDILLRNVSFMGFPSFQIIVPNMSELITTKEIDFNVLFNRSKIRKIVKKINSASSEELQLVIDYVKKYNYDNNDSIISFANLPFYDLSLWHNMRTDLFTYAAYYKMGNLEESLNAISKFITEMGPSIGDEASAYYKCIRDYIGTKIDNLNLKEAKEYLGIFYDESILASVIEELADPSEIFDWCGDLNCFNCSDCDFNKTCYYSELEELHIKIKDIHSKNCINQLDNRHYIP
ncbi:YcaO-like family protein [Clostridiaceae bacterium UIB06]|uniref:YcaO-like family protein n=1 Tax=Clostridium thailandense TaxID=2794346 RepID=A0A949X403_9CLOT|nr:YcaO-like family protein [Clostridium thailandense]MBV7273213.1 YcaO-like family protein [Clostridium thailandense]MCH5136070.1 YcaO-like family protein [Clostridiaceae bacterium UIB06]